jgi:sugar transferase (PEP-CTERM/EpsH1 system associated)
MGSPRLLFLAHRIPYPPDKGEKIRAWHMLEHLARDWAVDLGCLVDDPADTQHLPVLRDCCTEILASPVTRNGRIARTLFGTRPGQPLSLAWFHEPRLARWVRAGLDARRYDAVMVYSSAMAAYVPRLPDAPLQILDMVDVDSEKWRAYAATTEGPRRMIWAREARTLLAFERRAAALFDRTLLVSPQEARTFATLAPEVASRLDWVENGVDVARFTPQGDWPNPFEGQSPAVVFTGTMGYRPNIEAVEFFARDVMPRLASIAPQPHFHIVGANPSPAVQALAQLPRVHVTGSVPDIRPYLAHAAVAVAPLRIARGVQNKVLEAMAMARPVVASPEAHEGVHAVAGRDLLVADGAEPLARAVTQVLAGRAPGLGTAARAAVLAGHDWKATLKRLDQILARASRSRRAQREVPLMLH